MSLPTDQYSVGPELSDILQRFLPEYQKQHTLTVQQKKTVTDILKCRTPLMGGYVEQCDHCNEIRVTYHSCKNRHCPQCQFVRAYEWTQKRSTELLPVRYFHCVFTIPDTLHPIFRSNPKDCYRLIFKAVSETLLMLSKDKKRLGATPTITAVLHTWTQKLLYHPHLHCIVSGGGLSESGKWIPSPRTDFLFHFRPVEKMFRNKLITYLRELSEVTSNPELYQLTRIAYDQTWNLLIKPSFAGPKTVLDYLSQYTHRIAISNRRIVAMQADTVTFQYKDRNDGDTMKLMTVSGVEFIRRFIQHILPFGFVKIRYYGLLANKKKAHMLKRAREVLDVESIPIEPLVDWQEYLSNTFDSGLFLCPKCRKGIFHRTNIRLDRVVQERGP